jgi:hypothetical protein
LPRYETREDLATERGIADQLALTWQCRLEKLNPTSPIDYCAMRGRRVVAWVEIKRRSKPMHEIASLGGVMVNLEKIKAVSDISQITGIPFLLVISTSDGIYASKFQDDFTPDDLTLCGRKDRNDPNDIEACAVYRADRFKALGGKP